jgi:nucleosome assembly protein 1-like 1
MSDDDNKNNSPPSLESDDEEEVAEEQEQGATSESVATKGKQPEETTATPSNTPVVSLFSKVPQQSSAVKRSFEGEPTTKDVNTLLNSLSIGEASSKKAPAAAPKSNTADPEDEDENENDDEGEGDEEDDEEEEEEYVATPEQVEAALPLLRENHHKIEELKQKYQEARRELELKFEELRVVHYKARAELIRGTGDEGPALPGFWLDAMQRNMLVSQFIEEWDEPALIFLDDITVNELKDDFGFEIVFRFSRNPFFTNTTLTKKLIVSNLYAPDYVMPSIEQSIGTEINWHPNQNLTVKVEVKEVKRAARKGGKKGGAKEIRQEIPQDSFFNFFKTRAEKTPEELEQMEEADEDAYQREWETDFAIASTLRAKIVPDATLWYTGEASDSEYGDEDEEGDEDEDEDDEDDDEEFDELEDEEDEDEDEKPKGGKKQGGKGKPLSAQGQGVGKEGEQPECKQQ